MSRKPENAVLNTLMLNVESFERIYEDSWSKKEDLSKLNITLSSSFLVFTVSVAAFINNSDPGKSFDVSKLFESWAGFILAIVLSLFCLALLAYLKGTKIRAFNKRYTFKAVVDEIDYSKPEGIQPFTDLVIEVLEPVQRISKAVNVFLIFAYISFLFALMKLMWGVSLSS